MRPPPGTLADYERVRVGTSFMSLDAEEPTREYQPALLSWLLSEARACSDATADRCICQRSDLALVDGFRCRCARPEPIDDPPTAALPRPTVRPEVLASALQDPVHKEAGPSQPARTVRR